MNAKIEIKNLHKSFHKLEVLKGIDLTINEGEVVCIIGPSGSGKSTLLRCLNRLEESTSGTIIVDGYDITDKKININKVRENIGMVFQNFNLFSHLTVEKNIMLAPVDLKKMTKEEAHKTALELLRRVGLEDKADNYPHQLSGGQQQRVALARALVLEPGVLLFDEPLSNLDAKLRVSMRTEIRRIQQEAGITAIYVTHDQSEAMALSDQIIIMEKGVVSQIGTPQEIYYHPANEFVADFIGEANFLRGTLSQKQGDKGVVVVEGTSVDVTGVYGIQQGNGCTLVLRPESAVLSDRGQLPCKVIVSCFMGAYQNYHVMVGNTMVKITDFNPKNKKIYQVGDTAYVAFEKENIHVL